MADILVVGSANIDYSLGVRRLPGPGETVTADIFEQMVGGKGVNQAVAAARAGGSVAMLACVGDDQHGLTLHAALEGEGIVTEHVSVLPAPSGVAVVTTAAGGDNMIVVVPGANALLLPNLLDPGQFAGRGVVLCQLEVPIETVVRAAALAHAADATFILDPAPARPLPRGMLAHIDWLTPNESEARSLLDLPDGDFDAVAAARAIRAMGVGGVILKLGARGSLVLGGDDEPVSIPACVVTAIDTTAAGDAFNGAFAVALDEGAIPADAARFASAAAALAVTRRGAVDAMAHRREIEQRIVGDRPPAVASH